MKKTYQKPLIEIEAYQLDASIAGACGTVVTLGPGDYQNHVCEEYKDIFGMQAIQPIQTNATPFYDGVDGDACDCYYSAGNGGLFSS